MKYIQEAIIMTKDKINEKYKDAKGKKFDGDKLEWGLVPFEALHGVVERFGGGKKKYGAWNWIEVDDAKERYFNGLMRHLVAYRSGEELDNDPQFENTKRAKFHLTTALWNLLVLEYLDMKEKKQLNENPKIDQK